jgi:hypothetical protein
VLDRAEDQLSALLDGTLEQLDIPRELHHQAVQQYHRVARYLGVDDELSDEDVAIYTQGSFRLGTVVLPIGRTDYDIDLVFRLALALEQTTKQGLKDLAGHRLAGFVRDCADDRPCLSEGGRCWTLAWNWFHLDILPAIPDVDSLPHGIRITDRTLRTWLRSNPIGYSGWFFNQMAKELFSLREALAKKRGVSIEDVKDWEVKTILQRVVQVLKRHRDLFFLAEPDQKPPSILLTTLAAQAYRGEASLFEAVAHAAAAMPGLVESRDGKLWVPNPVQDEENFADKWEAHPERYQQFVSWMGHLKQDLEAAAEQRGPDRVVGRLVEGFGVEVKKAAEAFGLHYQDTRRTGALLSAAGTGALVTSRGARVRDHTFYGKH